MEQEEKGTKKNNNKGESFLKNRKRIKKNFLAIHWEDNVTTKD